MIQAPQPESRCNSLAYRSRGMSSDEVTPTHTLLPGRYVFTASRVPCSSARPPYVVEAVDKRIRVGGWTTNLRKHGFAVVDSDPADDLHAAPAAYAFPARR
jgi:hypothetical protein